MSFLIPSSAAILRPASRPSYSAVLLVACSLGKCIWTMYLRCSPVGATSSTPAPAPCSEKAPSKYISHSLLASLPGMLVSGISSSGVGVHSAMNSANALLWIVEVLSNLRPKLGKSASSNTYGDGAPSRFGGGRRLREERIEAMHTNDFTQLRAARMRKTLLLLV